MPNDESVPIDNSGGKGFDYTRFDFPSDRLTIRDVRTREPHRVDIESPHLTSDKPNSIELLLFLERYIAKGAFAIAMGKGKDYIDVAQEGGLREYEDDLVREYLFYDLARTTHEAKDLIRTIKDQSRSQARAAQGLDPSGGRSGRE